MTRDDIIRIAREAGYMEVDPSQDPIDLLTRFAALVAAHKTEIALAEAYRCGHEAGMVDGRAAFAKLAAEVAVSEAYRCGYEAGMVDERAACAKLAADFAVDTDDEWVCDQLAEAIRNMGKK